MGLQYELFFGVDGRRGLPAEHEPLVDRSARINAGSRPMSDPEYACALSHLMIYRRIVERVRSVADPRVPRRDGQVWAAKAVRLKTSPDTGLLAEVAGQTPLPAAGPGEALLRN